jgi:hypothetical protein
VSCGTCTMCCKLMSVPELEKPTCAWCPRVEKGRGCGAYADRPQACRDFECVWLQSQSSSHPLGAELRPDHTRVVTTLTTPTDRIPQQALVMHVDPDRPEAYKAGAHGRFVASMVSKGARIFVVIGDRRIALTGV